MANLVELKHRSISHPCFDEGARGTCGRIHLPVAPRCNIQCGYCSRAYDCVNESRPGVTSRVLEPEEAVDYLERMLALMPYITVAGIAGPGDAFCDPERTLTTIELIRKKHRRLNLCLSTNGLEIGRFIKDLSRLRVGYVTVTVNAAFPETGALIYSYIRNDSEVLRGSEGAGILMARQWGAITALKAAGITVKINTVVVSGINQGEVEDIARRSSELGADLMNIIPAIAVPGTRLEHAPALAPAELHELRITAQRYMPQMSHCVRCRADAVGMLGCREQVSMVCRGESGSRSCGMILK
jgi:nitrogen fixation protein NifB